MPNRQNHDPVEIDRKTDLVYVLTALIGSNSRTERPDVETFRRLREFTRALTTFCNRFRVRVRQSLFPTHLQVSPCVFGATIVIARYVYGRTVAKFRSNGTPAIGTPTYYPNSDRPYSTNTYCVHPIARDTSSGPSKIEIASVRRSFRVAIGVRARSKGKNNYNRPKKTIRWYYYYYVCRRRPSVRNVKFPHKFDFFPEPKQTKKKRQVILAYPLYSAI